MAEQPSEIVCPLSRDGQPSGSGVFFVRALDFSAPFADRTTRHGTLYIYLTALSAVAVAKRISRPGLKNTRSW